MVVELVSVGVPAACPMSQLEEMLTAMALDRSIPPRNAQFSRRVARRARGRQSHREDRASCTPRAPTDGKPRSQRGSDGHLER
jgi:hypothetical protein